MTRNPYKKLQKALLRELRLRTGEEGSCAILASLISCIDKAVDGRDSLEIRSLSLTVNGFFETECDTSDSLSEAFPEGLPL